ncbi:hypothetical protein [Haladaptatus caseinilyticus]|uniref:hypothetical protein n=1 Tax=Haladaptatus caseinilyticus TaxID=2993314 RepID=UPI00224B4D31|nr:hypothetical protein [Haladaptatus caseinilyticus]
MNLPESRTPLGVIGVTVAGVALWFGGGIVGLLAAGVLLALWYLLPASYAVTFGQFALVALVLPAGTPPVIVAGEVGLVTILLEPSFALETNRMRVAIGAGCIGLFTSGVWLLYLWNGSLWLPTVALVGTLILAFYSLHRYEMAVREAMIGEADG